MGDSHSSAGDENGVIYGAFIQAKLNAFKSTVEKKHRREVDSRDGRTRLQGRIQ